MNIDKSGLFFIKGFEGFKPKPYLDSGKKPTIGIGTVKYPDGRDVSLLDTEISLEQALSYLENHISKFIEPYLNKTFPKLNQSQHNALCSFCYNEGEKALDTSHLKKLILEGGTSDEILSSFMCWDKVKGVTIPGLLSRRNSEAKLFLKGI